MSGKNKNDLPIEEQVSKIEAEVTAKVISEAKESVFIEGWGTFYRRGNGWHGPGGFYGPSTEMGKRCEQEFFNLKEIREYWSNTMQRNHDYYVFLFRHNNGNLSSEDMGQYNLAIQHEKDGEVNPLSSDAVSPFG